MPERITTNSHQEEKEEEEEPITAATKRSTEMAAPRVSSRSRRLRLHHHPRQ